VTISDIGFLLLDVIVFFSTQPRAIMVVVPVTTAGAKRPHRPLFPPPVTPSGGTFGLVAHLRPLTQSVYSANTIPSDEACVFDFQISLRDDYAGISDI
jgi:hypothetical protein